MSDYIRRIRRRLANIFSSANDNDRLVPASDSALHDAAREGDFEKVKSIISIDRRKVNTTYGSYNQTPLHLASLNGRAEIVKYLLNNSAVIECKTRLGATPLICAAQQGHLNVVQILVQHGARLDATQRNGARAIHAASQNNHPDVVSFLVQEAGESVDVVSTILLLLGTIYVGILDCGLQFNAR